MEVLVNLRIVGFSRVFNRIVNLSLIYWKLVVNSEVFMFGKIFNFFEQVKQEMAKVVWPTRRETISSAIMIAVFSIVAAVFFFLVDRFFMWVMSFIFNF